MAEDLFNPSGGYAEALPSEAIAPVGGFAEPLTGGLVPGASAAPKLSSSDLIKAKLAEGDLARAEQKKLEEETSRLATAGTQFGRGVLDAILGSGALAGAALEGTGNVTGWRGLEDFGRDLGESASGASAIEAGRFIFGEGRHEKTTAHQELEKQQQAWPMLSAISHGAGMVATGLAAGGPAGGLRGVAALGALEGAGSGAQAAYEEHAPLRDVLTSALTGAAVGGALGGAGQLAGVGLGRAARFARESPVAAKLAGVARNLAKERAENLVGTAVGGLVGSTFGHGLIGSVVGTAVSRAIKNKLGKVVAEVVEEAGPKFARITVDEAGGIEAANAVNAFRKMRAGADAAADAAGSNPTLRNKAREEFVEKVKAGLGDEAFDVGTWSEGKLKPLQKILRRDEILDRVATDATLTAKGLQRATPELDFDLNPERLRRKLKNADGPLAIQNLQGAVRRVTQGPRTVQGDQAGLLLRKAANDLDRTGTVESFERGHKLIRELNDLAKNAPDEVTQKFLENRIQEVRGAMVDPAFGDAGALYAKISPSPSPEFIGLTDPKTTREALVNLKERGALPTIVRDQARKIEDAFQAARALSGTKPPVGMAEGLRRAEKLFSRAEEAVTLDGSSAGRVFKHLEEAPEASKVPAPTDIVAATVAPKVRMIFRSLARTSGRVSVDREPARAVAANEPQTRQERVATYNRRLDALTEALTSRDLAESIAVGANSVPGINPALAEQALQAQQEAIKRLLNDMPKPREDIRGKAYETLSDSELRTANAMWEATMDPLSVFDDLASGRLNPDKSSYAWKQYPGLQEACQAGVIDMIQAQLDESTRASIPQGSLTQLDYALGFEGTLSDTVSPMVSQTMSQLAEAQAQQQGQGGRRGGGSNPSTAQLYGTYSQRITAKAI